MLPNEHYDIDPMSLRYAQLMINGSDLVSLFSPAKTMVETPLTIIFSDNAMSVRLVNRLKSAAQSLDPAIADLEVHFLPISTELEQMDNQNLKISVIDDGNQKNTLNLNQILSLVFGKTTLNMYVFQAFFPKLWQTIEN